MSNNTKSVKFGQPASIPKSTKLNGKKPVFDEEIEDKTTDESNTSMQEEPAEDGRMKKSAQDRAGVKFPINKLSKFAKNGKFADMIGQGATVYMAGVHEYLCYEILELASNKAGEDKKKQIMPRHIMLAIKTDVEFNKFLKGCDFKAAGRVPVMHQDKNNKKKKGTMDDDDSDEFTANDANEDEYWVSL